MSEITSPIMLDDTGQDLVTEAQNIVTKLQSLINAVKPTAADIPLAAISGMTADDVQEGVAELKSNLSNIGNWVELLTTNSAITTTATSYDLNDDFTKYKSLVLQLCRYDNVYDSMILSSSYFNTTHNGGRPFLLVTNASYQTEVYKNTTSKVYIKSIANMDNTYNVKIFGIK